MRWSRDKTVARPYGRSGESTRFTRFPDRTGLAKNQVAGPIPEPPRDETRINPFARPRTPPPSPAVAEDAATYKARDVKSARSLVIAIFLATLVMPLILQVGTLRLTPYRMFLVLGYFPLLGMWLGGRCGPIRAADLFLFGFAAWASIALVVFAGAGRLEFLAVNFIETTGGYLAGRALIRSISDVRQFVAVMFVLMLILLPGAIAETFFAIRPFNEFFDLFGDTLKWAAYQRAGVYRAQGVFEHPILFGVFCSTTFSYFFFSRNSKGRQRGWTWAWVSLANTGLSLSAGAYFSLAGQFGLVIWNWVLRSFRWRWHLLVGGVAGGYVLVDMLSNRTPFEVVASYMTFDAGTAYWRILIFRYGMENVWANPIFGIGLGNWARPGWMSTASVDNYWLLMTMRYGIPAFVLLLGSVLSMLFALGRKRLHSEEARAFRQSHMFVLISLFVAMATVHIWNATLVYVMFLWGAGMWVTEEDAEIPEGHEPPKTRGGWSRPR